MRKVQERGNELATVLISTYLRDLHWCTTHLGTKVQLFYERAKRWCIFHYCSIKFDLVYHQSSIYEFPDSVIRPFPLLVCEGSTSSLESWKVGRQVVSGWIFLLRRVFSPKTFPLSRLYNGRRRQRKQATDGKIRRQEKRNGLQTNEAEFWRFIRKPFLFPFVVSSLLAQSQGRRQTALLQENHVPVSR